MNSIEPVTEVANTPFLLAGLGNPGRKYRNNRHNVGFMVVDRIARELNIAFARVQSRAIIATGTYSDHRVILAKPQTYMNLSGQAIPSLLKFYKIPSVQLLVIYDDMDLPLGSLRLRPGGGSAGQKGLANTIDRLGTQEFPRLRIGIDHPSGSVDPVNYLLDDFTRGEEQFVKEIIERAAQAALVFIKEGLNSAMNQFNGTFPGM